jgi:hypothetical protein
MGARTGYRVGREGLLLKCERERQKKEHQENDRRQDKCLNAAEGRERISSAGLETRKNAEKRERRKGVARLAQASDEGASPVL